MKIKQRKIIALSIVTFILIAIASLYSYADNLYNIIHAHSYQYVYFPSRDVVNAPAAEGSPAVAVPVLMYHGVRVVGELGTNTERDNFIQQMEMLKREGYQTISVNEYDLFRQGKFILPVKPIIITFDDARKDSYYTVDSIIKKIGFKATNFVATVKQNEEDKFFLNWEELNKMKESGRWELEAHGRHSHDTVVIDENGNLGRYLTSRIYNPETGLESIEAFESRVQQDYLGGIQDMQKNLGIVPKYFAVPLNDYGDQSSNYEDGIIFNMKLSETHFRFSFIESLSENNKVFETFYNYIDSNPQTLKRLEVMNMSAADLKFALDKFAPSKPKIIFHNGSFDLNYIYPAYGTTSIINSELVIDTIDPSTAARAVLGDKGWENYSFSANIVRGQAREATALIYYIDEENAVIMDWEDTNVAVTERLNGIDDRIVSVDLKVDTHGPVEVIMSVNKGLLNVSFNGVELISDHKIKIPRGAPAFGVWDPNGGEVKLTSYSVISLE